MQDKDAANTMAAHGNPNVLDDVTLENTIHSRPDQPERNFTQRRILVVEDDTSLANLEAEVLTAHGYEVTLVGNGEQAIVAFRQSIPDLVVLDLELSDTALTGWDVLQVLRTTTDIPVLFTSSADAVVRNYLRNQGENKLTLDYLPKPYPIQTLLKRIKRMLMIAPQ